MNNFLMDDPDPFLCTYQQKYFQIYSESGFKRL
jgi:hypothetical protein